MADERFARENMMLVLAQYIREDEKRKSPKQLMKLWTIDNDILTKIKRAESKRKKGLMAELKRRAKMYNALPGEQSAMSQKKQVLGIKRPLSVSSCDDQSESDDSDDDEPGTSDAEDENADAFAAFGKYTQEFTQQHHLALNRESFKSIKNFHAVPLSPDSHRQVVLQPTASGISSNCLNPASYIDVKTLKELSDVAKLLRVNDDQLARIDDIRGRLSLEINRFVNLDRNQHEVRSVNYPLNNV